MVGRDQVAMRNVTVSLGVTGTYLNPCLLWITDASSGVLPDGRWLMAGFLVTATAVEVY